MTEQNKKDSFDSPPPLTAGAPANARLKLLWGILIVVAVGISIAFFLKLLRDNTRVNPKPSLGHIPAFSLTQASGAQFTRDDLKGKIWVTGFIYTTCSGICPQMTSQMYRAMETIPDTNVRFISITVDPEHDTPNVLHEYATLYGLPERRWVLLTGDEKAIYKLALDGFHLPLAAGSTKEDPFVHSSRLTLIDTRADIRGYYDAGDTLAMKQLHFDIKQIENEK